MIGVILAAGMAKRLRPLTDKQPKCLLEVGGKTLLERTVNAMLQAGISEFVVVTGYRNKMIENFLNRKYAIEAIEAIEAIDAIDAIETIDAIEAIDTIETIETIAPVTFHFINNADYEHNNNIYSLWMAGQVVRGKEFLLMDSDILCDPQAVLEVARQETSALALNQHELGEEEMKIIVDSEMRITEISKTCRPEDAIGESVGIEKISADYSEALFRELDQMIEQEGLIDIFYERAFERLIPQGHTFKVIDNTNYFSYELDTPEDFERATQLMPKELQ